ncbi:MAG: histidine phosphatase family protein [Bacteroidota bacterium]
MGQLIVIRHAQASLMKEDYDQISDLGAIQSAALGHFLAEYHPEIDQVFRGNLKRHHQTTSIIRETLKSEGIETPEPTVLPEWNEHEGQKMGKYFIPKLIGVDPVMKEHAKSLGPDESANKRVFLRIFHRLTELWSEGKIDTEEAGAESWASFQERIQQGMQAIQESIQPNTKNLLITSGGSISVLMGEVLGLDVKKVLELSWIVKNTSISEFRVEPDGLKMRSFNEVGHLEPKLITYV